MNVCIKTTNYNKSLLRVVRRIRADKGDMTSAYLITQSSRDHQYPLLCGQTVK